MLATRPQILFLSEYCHNAYIFINTHMFYCHVLHFAPRCLVAIGQQLHVVRLHIVLNRSCNDILTASSQRLSNAKKVQCAAGSLC